MNAILPVIIHVLDRFCGLAMLFGVISGTLMSMAVIFQKRKITLTNFLSAILLLLFSCTLLSNYFIYKLIYPAYPVLYFLPIHASFSLGPLFFFYIKSRLYPALRITPQDNKHFLMPVLQLVTLGILSFTGIPFRREVMECCSSPIYGFVENALYIWLMGMYLYFAYSFIRHERYSVLRTGADKRFILMLGWLKRQTKVLTILFGIHATCLISFFISYRFLGVDLSGKILFSLVRELSFAGMLYWLVLNAFFALRRGL